MEKPKIKRTPIQGPFTCYILRHSKSRATYTGQTNNFKRRLRQHNGEIKGGARYTKMKRGTGSWSPLFRVKGFSTIGAVLRFERAMKRHRQGPGPRGRVRQLEVLLSAGRIKESVTVKVHCSQEDYLAWAGVGAEEYLERREEQKDTINFVFQS